VGKKKEYNTTDGASRGAFARKLRNAVSTTLGETYGNLPTFFLEMEAENKKDYSMKFGEKGGAKG